MYAASSLEGKKYFAPTLVAWNAIMSSKKEGKKIFDFEGIYDERFPLNSWKGFSRFKNGFGGNVVSYPGCLSKTIF
jgi:lipid II:glycine glycyltransferase (peptidoglycan interpeptide bridge formation enzyme)